MILQLLFLTAVSLPEPKIIGDWRLEYSIESLNDDTKITLTATDRETELGFVCWKGSGKFMARLSPLSIQGVPVYGTIRLSREPGRQATWILVNDRFVQTDVTSEEIESVIQARGRIVVELLTDRAEGFKRRYEAPRSVRRAITTFLGTCGRRQLPLSSDADEQIAILREELSDAMAILASSADPIQARLQIAWDDYLKHLTLEHMPTDTTKLQLEALWTEVEEREPNDLTEEEASSAAYAVWRLYESLGT